jgi:hypothetical protein
MRYDTQTPTTVAMNPSTPITIPMISAVCRLFPLSLDLLLLLPLAVTVDEEVGSLGLLSLLDVGGDVVRACDEEEEVGDEGSGVLDGDGEEVEDEVVDD